MIDSPLYPPSGLQWPNLFLILGRSIGCMLDLNAEATQPSEGEHIAEQAHHQMLHVKAFSGPAARTYLCDAGCRPNPGEQLPVVWDGEKFLEEKSRTGTNHQAAYQAIEAALKDASKHNLTHIELQLTSDLVFKQLSTGSYCRSNTLKHLREIVASLAERSAPVRLILVRPPFSISAQTLKSKRALRSVALLALSQGEVQP